MDDRDHEVSAPDPLLRSKTGWRHLLRPKYGVLRLTQVSSSNDNFYYDQDAATRWKMLSPILNA